MPGFMKGRRSLSTTGCLMIMEIWAIYPLLELPYLAWISHFSAPLIYSSRRLEEPKENWLHNSIWKTLQQYYVILWIQKWRSWRKIYTCAPERFVIRERKGKKGFLKFEANGNLSHVSALIWLEFHTFTHDWVSRKKNEITQKKNESKKSQVDGKKIPKANSKLFVKA